MESIDDLREGLVYSSINSRLRAVMLCIQWALADVRWPDAKIYATEAVTPFALRLRGFFAKFIGSEYAETEAQRDELFPIPCEDLQRLSFPNDAFHLVTTNEVLEHVPSIDAALGEVHRVLRDGGWHIGTAPFAMGQYESVTKAKLQDGKIIHLTEPEYHGNPVDERGSLVFQIPGWDILDRAKAVGFRDAHVKYILSPQHACLSSDAGGIFVFCLQK
jgi:SAM-dependent methyltransferase